MSSVKGAKKNERLESNERQAIFQYYRKLNAFFMGLEDRRDRSGNSRAIKARSKLLNLSESQFFELGTDVHDELERRLRPDKFGQHLVADDALHVKRNQARQKLANLSDTRFNDLIDDILYEIQRRNYDVDPTFDNPPATTTTTSSTPVEINKEDVEREMASDKQAAQGPHLKPKTSSASILNGGAIQTTKVVPKKAAMEWSSDEEEEEKEKEEMQMQPQQQDTEKEEAPSGFVKRGLMIKTLSAKPSMDNVNSQAPKSPVPTASVPNSPAPKSPIPAFSPAHRQHPSIAAAVLHIDPAATSEEIDALKGTIAELEVQRDELVLKNTELAETNAQLKLTAESVHETLAANAEQIDLLTAQLEEKTLVLENLAAELDAKTTACGEVATQLENRTAELDNLVSRLEEKSLHCDSLARDLEEKTTECESLQQTQRHSEELGTIATKVSDLSIENELLKQTIAELELASRTPAKEETHVNTVEHTREQETQPQCADANIDYSRYTDSQGLIPLGLVTDLQARVTAAVAHLNTAPSETNIGEVLFEDIALISECVSKIVSRCESSFPKSSSIPYSMDGSSTIINNNNNNNNVTDSAGNTTGADRADAASFQDHAILLRAAVSHAITTIRYFAIYHALLPKITVHSALNEILYTVCNLLNVAHINNSDAGTREFDSADEGTDTANRLFHQRNIGRLETQDSANSEFQQLILTKLDMQKNTLGDSDEDVSSPVRPLKITQKLASPMKKTSGHSDAQSGNGSPTGAAGTTTRDLQGASSTSSSSAPHEPQQRKYSNTGFFSAILSSSSSKPGQSNSGDNNKRNVKKLSLNLPRANEEFKKKRSGSTTSTMSNKSATTLGAAETVGSELPTIDDTHNEDAVLDEPETFVAGEEDQPDTDVDADTSAPTLNNKSKMINSFNLQDEDDSDEAGHYGSGAVDTVDSDNEDLVLAQLRSSLKNDPSATKHEEQAPTVSPLVVDQEKQYDQEEQEEPAEDFNVQSFDVSNPDNSLNELLLYLEHQTIDVISTIQSLLTSIKQPKSKTGELRNESFAINKVVGQMVEATSVSMDQSRNLALKEYGGWVVQSLNDCTRRMKLLCSLEDNMSAERVQELENDETYADKHFKQRLAGIAFDVAKCTKELVKIVEEASLKEEIQILDKNMNLR